MFQKAVELLMCKVFRGMRYMKKKRKYKTKEMKRLAIIEYFFNKVFLVALGF